ncbi:NUDIX domain-containing protein [Mechercharimyces sp. CAU 1602]|uniref:NUDIX domain-containing protein n=1 Tax=Mechercharimyces sp. CAU 1602 TaxID=2973933 RepID=UPI002163A60B|nr:NUDIX domain-containing protein [Mechercharimyces sp. CAU 1602]MCS1350484.1 NUDIX domain-containing protein [Mechercharimyces sp. CAU 1602]
MKKRPSARVVLMNEESRVLLFNMMDQLNPGQGSIWFTVGGGLEEEETYEEAAKRELWEETGLENVKWGPLIWIRQFEHIYQGEPTLFVEHYFLAFIRGAEQRKVNLDYLTLVEKETYLGHHWWSLEELEESEEKIYPREMKRLLEPIVNGSLPREPIAIAK